MTDDKVAKDYDEGKVTLISHICLRDPDSGEIILKQREKIFEKVNDESNDR